MSHTLIIGCGDTGLRVAARAVARLLAALAGTIDPGRDRLDRILRQRPPR